MSPDLDLAVAEWVRSSYSDASGGNCVEFSRTFSWVKSSYSDGDGGQCLEFSRVLTEPHGLVPVRDSKDPEGPALIFPAGGWSAFVSAVKRGQFTA
ncbi:toxin [Streptomyces libani subsp. rufus]|nr:toxin [Streptomyces libani subsp. rufus]